MADNDPYTDVQLTDGTTLRFQGDLLPAQLRMKVAAYRAGPGKANTDITNPQQMQQMAQGQAQQVTSPEQAGAAMQNSSAPGYVRGATTALPFAGAIGGGVLGAPAFGGGAIVGGALGGAAGMQGKLLADRAIFGPEETSPISKTGLTETGIAGLSGAVSEIPAAVAIGRGNYLLKTLGQAKSAQQVGDVLEAFKSVNPVAGTRTGLQQGLELAGKKLNQQLGTVLSAATNTVDFGATVEARAMAEAATEDAAFTGRSPVSNALQNAIAGAKSNAGIRGNIATAEQLWKFQQQIGDKAFKKAILDQNPGVGSVVNRILQSGYRNSGVMLRGLAPDADPLLEQLTDIHAGVTALKNVGKFGGIGKLGGISVSAALNPRITAALSPEVTAAMGASTQIPIVKKATDFITDKATTP